LARGDKQPHQSTILAYGVLESDDLPSLAPQNVLWAHHQHVFAGLTWQESKERYYQYLYYNDLNENDLRNLLRGGERMSVVSLFGWSRHTNRLTTESKPLTYGEIDEEAARFGEYIKNFSVARASAPELSYIVAANDWQTNFTNLDKWYERGDGEVLGNYTLYQVKLRTRQ
jgi:hypothetical protein